MHNIDFPLSNLRGEPLRMGLYRDEPIYAEDAWYFLGWKWSDGTVFDESGVLWDHWIHEVHPRTPVSTGILTYAGVAVVGEAVAHASVCEQGRRNLLYSLMVK